ncbi:unnamed protein product [Brassicogethes aeneus]|uniref:C2H2-type domain-containing protein n=1 Tax=Brassicogethes aeneus TaxID=1431903 RepID=A0A9P0FHJ7_BRAAE|nr:unnamed protein product [Brassicogethes aeneus]
MWGEDYHWHFDYVRLAWDTGFNFEKRKSCNLDKSKICLLDIEQIIQDRDIAAVERYISTVLQYILDNEQAEILDTNFVKMFRISQLAVEYLLFCKKYLDNTAVLLKKELAAVKEENNELKEFTVELEGHIEKLTSKLSELSENSTFKCSKCFKLFSSETYLKSHIKRRHTVYDENSSTQSEADKNKIEADKLQSEIKDLKERLNNTEKLINDKNNLEEQFTGKIENVAVKEIQENFEQFKSQVASELKVLQAQRNFYEEKYGRLMDVVSDTLIKKNNEKGQINEIKVDNSEKTSTTTQTERKERKKLTMELVHDKNVFNYVSPQPSPSKTLETNETKESVVDIEKTIERKVSEGLEKIESQMNVFLNKLTDYKETKVLAEVPNSPILDNLDKPKVKPRSKFTITNRLVECIPQHKKESVVKITETRKEKEANILSESSSSEGSSILETPRKKMTPKKTSVSTLGNHSITRAANQKEVFEELKVEVENVVNSRLQEIGISPDWNTLPKQSFNKAIEIIRHQANLTKKTYPDFFNIKADIERKVKQEKVSNKVTPKSVKKVIKPRKISYKPNEEVMNIKVRKKESPKM